MKQGIVIVNTARGGVMDEEALVKALDSGHVLSVGLDVYKQEPNIYPSLISNPHVCLLPHMGTSTVEVGLRCITRNEMRSANSHLQTKTQMEEWNIGNVKAALMQGKLNNIVPEQAHAV